jgi:ABC-type amino acid transport system permease subunit
MQPKSQSMERCLAFLSLLFLFVGEVFAQERLLEKVPQLQETARRANRGELGRTIGTITLITSRGQVKVEGVSATPFRLFGQPIKVSDLLPLLEARGEFNRTGAVNPMSGQVADLTYVVLYTLSLAKDPDTISVIAELLKDKDSVICGWAAIALYETAKFSEELRAKIEAIKFPQAAVDSARARGVPSPRWLQIESAN